MAATWIIGTQGLNIGAVCGNSLIQSPAKMATPSRSLSSAREEEESKVCEVVMLVEVLRPDDPRSCQMDARFQPRLSSDSVVPTKDVRIGCPDTPSDGFVSHG